MKKYFMFGNIRYKDLVLLEINKLHQIVKIVYDPNGVFDLGEKRPFNDELTFDAQGVIKNIFYTKDQYDFS
jgi:hypothetical protein